MGPLRSRVLHRTRPGIGVTLDSVEVWCTSDGARGPPPARAVIATTPPGLGPRRATVVNSVHRTRLPLARC